MVVRTSRTDRPVRRTSPVIRPSRGPGPSRAPTYSPVASPLSTMPPAASTIRTRHRVGQQTQQREERVHQRADHHDVRHRADPGPLPQRDPAGQHDHADEQRDQTERQVGAADDALGQDIPRHAAQSRVDEHRDRGGVEDEPDQAAAHHGGPGAPGDASRTAPREHTCARCRRSRVLEPVAVRRGRRSMTEPVAVDHEAERHAEAGDNEEDRKQYAHGPYTGSKWPRVE